MLIVIIFTLFQWGWCDYMNIFQECCMRFKKIIGYYFLKDYNDSLLFYSNLPYYFIIGYYFHSPRIPSRLHCSPASSFTLLSLHRRSKSALFILQLKRQTLFIFPYLYWSVSPNVYNHWCLHWSENLLQFCFSLLPDI